MSEKKVGFLVGSAQLLNAMGSFTSKIIWSIVGLIILATTGQVFMSMNAPKEYERADRPERVVPVVPAIPWHDVDVDIQAALHDAYAVADEHAEEALRELTARMESRVDSDFLEWYFGYWNQQWLGLKGISYWAAEKVLTDQPSMAERITGDIQEEFAKRVLRPEITQMRLERITTETLNVYMGSLSNNLAEIPDKYKIPRADWDRYLEDIAVLTSDVEGNRKVSLSLKAVTTSGAVGGVAGAALMTKALKPVITKVGTKYTAKAAAKGGGKMAAKIATKTGTKVGAKIGGKMLGPIIGVGIIVWDVWDHRHTKETEKPMLRENIVDYLGEMRESLLYDPETGIMSIVGTIEGNVVASLVDT